MCYNKLMVKKGDTLVEVTLAVGIFSMIAIAVVSVMNSGTSGAQTALEATLTREEVDAQAEALRFIQNSAASGDARFANLWDKISDNAKILEEEGNEALTTFTPFSCDSLYGENPEDPYSAIGQDAFIINTHGLSKLSSTNLSDDDFESAVDNVFIKAKNNSDGSISLNEKFSEATTYPHLIFTTADPASTPDSDTATLVDDTNYSVLSKAEGIYIVAVKDSESSDKSEFIDFYIRTCWYGSNDKTASTISTIIRLYDPNATN